MPRKKKSQYEPLIDDHVEFNQSEIASVFLTSTDIPDDPNLHIYSNHSAIESYENSLSINSNDTGHDVPSAKSCSVSMKTEDHGEYKEVVEFRSHSGCDSCKQMQAARISDVVSQGIVDNDFLAERTDKPVVDFKFETLCESCKQSINNGADNLYEIPEEGGSGCENVYDTVADTSSIFSDLSWSDSEFESYSDDPCPSQTSPQLSHQGRARPATVADENGILTRIRNHVLNRTSPLDRSSDVVMVPVVAADERHPVPCLPPAPPGLSINQTKRRRIVESIISSERSYVRSLQYILQEYRDVLLDVSYLFRGTVRVILRKIAELVQYHTMFQIELAEVAHKWDDSECIGDVFTASFSKSLVVDAYSEYVNNYAAAIEDIRKMIRQKQPFADMLKLKETASPDRLSIFGLMVKPVQRFPQFIMFLQDLLKYTGGDHADRMKLQRAVTQLEGIAHKLNDRKRDSEQKLAAKQIVGRLLRETITWRASIVDDGDRYLVRQDGFYQVNGHATPQVYKWRRLIMLSDLLICVNVHRREKEASGSGRRCGGASSERYKVKWCVPINDVELKETSITPDTYTDIKTATRWHSISSLRLEPTDDDPLGMLTDLTDLVHDYSVLSQIQCLSATLRRTYPGITDNVVADAISAVQVSIHQKDEQTRLVSSCSFVLEVPLRGTRRRYVFQAMTAQHKEDWITDLHMAQLARSPDNSPCWGVTRGGDEQTSNNPALFLKCLAVDVPRHYTKIECAVPVTLKPSSCTSTSVNHLWVCSSTPSIGQVSLVALQCNRPRVIESFIASTSRVVCIDVVPGYSDCHDNPYAFAESTVWMATARDEMIIFDIQNASGFRRQAKASFKTVPDVVVMKFYRNQLFVALKSGKLAIYSRNDGIWNVSCPSLVTIGHKAITCLLVLDEYVTCMSGNSISFLDPQTHEIQRVLSLDCDDGAVIQGVARAGMGLWVSYQDSSLIHLYHLETMDRLQDINVSSVVQKSIQENCDYYSGLVSVSCMVTSKGLLWIGTNTGHILTLPLPRLRDGVPQITSRPDVSFHSHRGPIKFIIPLYSAIIPKETAPAIRIIPDDDTQESSDVFERSNDQENYDENPTRKTTENGGENTSSCSDSKSKFSASSFSNSSHSTESDVFFSKEDLDLAFQVELRERLSQHTKRWKSTPNLADTEMTKDVNILYGSLMKGVDSVEATLRKAGTLKAREPRTLAAVGRRAYTRALRWRRGVSDNVDTFVRDVQKQPVYVNIDEVLSDKRCQSSTAYEDRMIPSGTSAADSSLTSVSDLDDAFSCSANPSVFRDLSPVGTSGSLSSAATPGEKSDTSEPGCFSKSVMVVSGGDGYCHWSHSPVSSTHHEASIMVWMYKADF